MTDYNLGANGIAERPELESLSTNDDGAKDDGQELDELGEGPSSSASFYSPSSPAKKKKSCCPNCLNKSLVGLKALLFIFYGGIGVLVTWLNHLEISRRFSEKECLLVYGLSSLLSAFTPFVFGLISDKSGQPKRVLAVCLLLAGLFYPLILLVPPAAPYDYQTRMERCSSDSGQDGRYCLPSNFNCHSGYSELLSLSGGCSRGCAGNLILSKCHFVDKNGSKVVDWPDYGDSTREASAQIDRPYDSTGPEVEEDEYPENPDSPDTVQSEPWTPAWPPHVCLAPGTHDLNSEHSEKSLCYAFDSQRKNGSINVAGISGHEDADGKCHYPLLYWSEELQRYEHMVNCSPIADHLQVSCELEWDTNKEDQWSCSSDFFQWAIVFSFFVALHTLGTMLLISAAGLLNVAILSMTHEHQGYFGCQLTYATLGFALFTPGAAHLFEYLKEFKILWSLEYVAAYSIWLLLSAVLALTLPHHAEWVPKPGTIGPTLRRWSCRGHTLLFFLILATLGGLQGMVDTLGFFQTKQLGATLIHLGFGGLAAMIPALIFIYRVEKVIEFCGYHNILGIALVVLSLQSTGYAYLRNVIPEWMYLLKALDTFSIVTVWAAAAHTTYNAAPRSLVASCQAIIVTLYCSLGRGLGCCLGYVLRLFLSREAVLQVLSIFCVLICIVYLVSHYCVLRPNPYSRHYDSEHAFAPKGKYTPLKLLQGQKGKPEKKSPTKASTEEAS